MKFTVIQDETNTILPKQAHAEITLLSPKTIKKPVKPKIDRYNMKRHLDQRPDSKDTKEFLNNMIEVAKIETQKEIEAIRKEVRMVSLL